MENLQILAAGVIAIGVAYCLYVKHLVKCDEAFSCGVKLGKVTAFMTQNEIDAIVRSAGLDPAKLPSRDQLGRKNT